MIVGIHLRKVFGSANKIGFIAAVRATGVDLNPIIKADFVKGLNAARCINVSYLINWIKTDNAR
jgi:hypothetical protein